VGRVLVIRVEEAERNLAGRSKRSSSEAAGEANTERIPSGYIEDVGEARTKLGKERVLACRGRAGGIEPFSSSCQKPRRGRESAAVVGVHE
jgi:hypothetical protein